MEQGPVVVNTEGARDLAFFIIEYMTSAESVNGVGRSPGGKTGRSRQALLMHNHTGWYAYLLGRGRDC